MGVALRAEASHVHRVGLIVSRPRRRRVAQESQVRPGSSLELERPTGGDDEGSAWADLLEKRLAVRRTAPHLALTCEEVPDLLDGPVPDGQAGAAGWQADLHQAGPASVPDHEGDL